MASKDARVKALTEEINSLNHKYENSVKVSDVLVYFVFVRVPGNTRGQPFVVCS